MHPLLSFLVLLQDSAPAQGSAPAAGPTGGAFNSFLIPMLLVVAVFWFVMIGPERKQRKKREQMLGSLSKGDKVLMQGGIYGSIAAVQDDVLTVQIAEGVRVRFARAAVQSKLEDEPAKEAGKASKDAGKPAKA